MDTPAEEGLQAVVGSRATIVDENPAEDTPTPTDSGEESRKYAGRYDSVEDLEKGYKSLTAEYTRSQQELKAAATQPQETQEPTEQSALDGDIRAQIQPYIAEATAPLEAALAEQQQGAFWSEMEAEYGKGIAEKVDEHFLSMHPDEQAQLDNIAGARLIAKLVGTKAKPVSTAQPIGGARTHNAPRSSLSSASINAMSPDEYARRQPEIMAYYRQA